MESVCQDLRSILNCYLQETTSRFAGIHLCEQEAQLSDDVCTIHAVLETPRHITLLLYADVSLMARLAQNIMHQEVVTQRDIQDVAIEYFNVVCGRVAANMYRAARISSRFQTPRFFQGCYLPDGHPCSQCVLNFKGENMENVRLVCMAGQCSNNTSLTCEPA